ncbi:MAG: hypothetical protein O7E54_02355, partial [Planctomycetota bacterium]|nr:hypothetical protein [Planctomycetota bacterium]
DQQRTSKALRLLLRTVERRLSRAELQSMIAGDVHNRVLLTYVFVRRIAAEENCRSALDVLARFAERHPRNELAHAWRARDSKADSFVGLPGQPDRLGAIHDRIAGGRSRTDRLRPPLEAMTLSVDALAKQIGLWEQVAELDQRMTTVRGDRAAALLLTLGKLALDEPEIFFPVYARHTAITGDNLQFSYRWRSWGTWTRTTIHAARAFRCFRRVELLYPEFPRMDEAIFLQAAALARLLHYRPMDPLPYQPPRDQPRGRERRAVLDACTRCRTLFPESEMAARADELARDCRERYAVLMRD